jgi:hypothetical protein
LKESVEAIVLLEEILSAVVDGSSSKLLFGKGHVLLGGCLNCTSKEDLSLICEKVEKSIPNKLVVESLLHSTRKLNSSLKADSQNKFSLLTSSGGTRKPVRKRKLTSNSSQDDTTMGDETLMTGVSQLTRKKSGQSLRDILQKFDGSSGTGRSGESGSFSGSGCSLDVDMKTYATFNRKCTSFFESLPSPDWLYEVMKGMSLTFCSDLFHSFERNRLVILSLKEFLSEDLVGYMCNVLDTKANQTRLSSQLSTRIRNNYRKTATSGKIIEDDGKRVSFTVSYDDIFDDFGMQDLTNNQFAAVIDWIIHFVKIIGEGKMVPFDAHPCASDGSAKKLHLIVGLPLCLPQHFHYDYDPKTFQSDGYHGASLFINYSLYSQTLDVGLCEHDPSIRKQIVIPPSSVLLIRGDLKHAGSSNCSDEDEVHKFFMYLDPYDVKLGNFRKQNSNTLYYDEYDDLSFILSSAERKALAEEEKLND